MTKELSEKVQAVFIDSFGTLPAHKDGVSVVQAKTINLNQIRALAPLEVKSLEINASKRGITITVS